MSFISSMCFAFLICVSDSARILGYFPMPSISHQVVYRTLTEELARRGHEVIVITTDPSPNPPKNYTEIVLHDKSYEIWRTELLFAAESRKQMDTPLRTMPTIINAVRKVVDYQISTPQFQTILQQNENYYDLLIVESLVSFSYGLTYKFKAPMIALSSMIGNFNNYAAVGVPTHPYLYPEFFSQYTGRLTLTQELISFYDYIQAQMLYDDFYFKMDGVAKKHFRGKILPLKAVEVESMDLLFLNVDPLFNGIRPVPKNTFFLNGLHLNSTSDAISKDLKDYLDAAEEGVIYFSMGSNVLMKDFPPEKWELFIAVFMKLPFKILWKFETSNLPNQPSNVKIMKWFPQMDLLGHKNVKLFIMQGGQQSIDEAIYNQVPMVVMPVLGDQDKNSKKVQFHGLGVTLKFNSLTEENLSNAIYAVINNASYKENMVKFSKLIADQEMSPLERAIWWTEYLLRNKSAKHLRSHVAGITWTESLLLDVITLIFGTIIIIMTLSILSLMYLVKVFKSRNKSKIN